MCLDDRLVSSCRGGPAFTLISWESKIRQAPFNLSHVVVVIYTQVSLFLSLYIYIKITICFWLVQEFWKIWARQCSKSASYVHNKISVIHQLTGMLMDTLKYPFIEGWLLQQSEVLAAEVCTRKYVMFAITCWSVSVCF
jgi:hypothetical protein